jgi:hypothetical protein
MVNLHILDIGTTASTGITNLLTGRNTPPQEASVKLKIMPRFFDYIIVLGVYPININLSDNLHPFRTTPIFTQNLLTFVSI